MAQIINSAFVRCYEEPEELVTPLVIEPTYTEEEITSVKKEAYQQGYAQGQKELREEMQEKKAQMEQLLRSIPQAIQQNRLELQHEIYSLTMFIIENLFKEQSINPHFLESQINQLLAEINEQQSIELHLHPQEIKALQEGFIRINTTHQIKIKQDEALTLGGFIIKTSHGLFNASIEQQITALKQFLQQRRGGVSHE